MVQYLTSHWTISLQIIPLKPPTLSPQDSWLSCSKHLCTEFALSYPASGGKKKKKHGKIRNRRWRTFHFSSAHHLTSATGLGVGDQCFFLDGANCSLIWLEPESSLNQLLLRGAVSGIEGTSEEGET